MHSNQYGISQAISRINGTICHETGTGRLGETEKADHEDRSYFDTLSAFDAVVPASALQGIDKSGERDNFCHGDR